MGRLLIKINIFLARAFLRELSYRFRRGEFNEDVYRGARQGVFDYIKTLKSKLTK